ncbi:MAG: two-component regulator propeller domain-containing protein [Bacteroidota bacterium]
MAAMGCLTFGWASSCSSQSTLPAGPALTQTPDTFLSYTTGIRSILEDSRGHVWFASHQEGVARFDGKEYTYYHMQDGLTDAQVRSLFEDTLGQVWFEGGYGLSSFDGEKIFPQMLKDYTMKYAWQDAPTDLWFKGDESVGFNEREGTAGVYRWNGKRLSYHTFPITYGPDMTFAYSISTPFERGKNGRLWFGTYGAVFGFENGKFDIITSERAGLNDSTGYLHVRGIMEDSKGNLWIGNNGIGVMLYDGDTLIHWSNEMGLRGANSQGGGARSPEGTLEHVFAIGEDREGNIWFGDRDTGAWRYDGEKVENITLADGSSLGHIWYYYVDKRGELWATCGNGGVCRFDGEVFRRVF